MHMAFSAIASGTAIRSKFKIEHLDWPHEGKEE